MTDRKDMDRDAQQAALRSRPDPGASSIPGTRPHDTPFGEAEAEALAPLAALAGAAQPAKPSPDLFARIEAELDAEACAPVRTVPAREGIWQKRTDKIWKKMLSEDPETGKAIYLLRCEPGAVIPEHVHEGREFAYVLEGAFWMGDRLVQAGDSQVSLPGSVHPPLLSPEGCLLLVHA